MPRQNNNKSTFLFEMYLILVLSGLAFCLAIAFAPWVLPAVFISAFHAVQAGLTAGSLLSCVGASFVGVGATTTAASLVYFPAKFAIKKAFTGLKSLFTRKLRKENATLRSDLRSAKQRCATHKHAHDKLRKERDDLLKQQGARASQVANGRQNVNTFLTRLTAINYIGAIPKHMECVVSRDVMNDPITLPNGRTYDRQALIDWSNRPQFSHLSTFTDPETRELFAKALLTSTGTNISLRDQIEDFVKRQETTHAAAQQVVVPQPAANSSRGFFSSVWNAIAGDERVQGSRFDIG